MKILCKCTLDKRNLFSFLIQRFNSNDQYFSTCSLYNGNIVLRGGKGKGKGGGNIVVANSHSMDMMPFLDQWGGFGRRK